ncbi:GNAT family N-acetyltransferase [Paenibacillus elgii]|uniref:GNAT family N-acetyltransferase n=1 Tax=Paenibacillus elgii TaxID=189691 RepID=UPI001CB9409C|nr:GNAT family N-acetyltransferase [Paenibacillus elgii]
MAIVRLATLDDVDELVRMRWDFSEEGYTSAVSFKEFYPICREFLIKAMGSGDWYIWVAEVEKSIVSHMYLQLIHKVPRPGKSPDSYYGYVTNVYTHPCFSKSRSRNRDSGRYGKMVKRKWGRIPYRLAQ